MGHSHHGHGPENDAAFGNIRSAFFLNLFFVIVEIVGAFFTGSVAILADAVHDLGDCLSLGFALFLEKYSQKGVDQSFSYGYRRFSLLSALLSGAAMCVAAFFVIYQTVDRFRHPVGSLPSGWGMMGLALFGMLVNGIAARRLTHGKTQNEKILKWHLLEDVAGWALVFVGAIFIQIKAWAWVDPALALVLSLYILWNVVANLRETSRLFLQAKPQDFNEKDFLKKVKELPGVESLHDLHVWSLDGHLNVLSLHVVLSKEAYGHSARVKKRIAEIAHEQSQSQSRYHLTIETESVDELCRESC